jgi:hypothetical protein
MPLLGILGKEREPEGKGQLRGGVPVPLPLLTKELMLPELWPLDTEIRLR